MRTPAPRSWPRMTSTSAASCALTCTMRPVTRACAATAGGSASSVLKRSIVLAVPASRLAVRSSATTRPCLSIAMRPHSASASSR